jgi:hypothetical protein
MGEETGEGMVRRRSAEEREGRWERSGRGLILNYIYFSGGH